MPKPMFLQIAVEESFFGRVFRALDGMAGVAGVTIVSERHPPKAAKPQGSATKGTTAACLILKTLEAGITHRDALGAMLEQNGKKAATAPSTLQSLLKAKHITARGNGTYKITPAGKKWRAGKCKGAA